jgi:hypothetical protein
MNSNCGPKFNSVYKTFIIQPLELTGGTPVLSACTALFTNFIQSCDDDTFISLNNGLISFGGDLVAPTIYAEAYYSGTTNIYDIFSRTDTFITGGTYNNVGNSLSLIRNDNGVIIITGLTDFYTTGVTLLNNTLFFHRNDSLSGYSVDLSTIIVTGDTFIETGVFSSETRTLILYRNDGEDIKISGFSDTFTTGATIVDNIIYFDRNDVLSAYTINLSAFSTSDIFVTAQTFNNETFILKTTRNDGLEITTDLSLLSNDVYVLSGIYEPTTGVVTYTNSTGGTFQVSGFTTGMTDSYTISSYVSGSTLFFNNNILGNDFYSVDILPIISGKTDLYLFNSYTANTETILNSKLDNGLNVGNASEIFSGKSGNTLVFKTLSGGTNTTITNFGEVVRIDVSIPPDTNTYVTGFTYDNVKTFTIRRNDGVILNTSIDTLSGVTYYGDGVGLFNIPISGITNLQFELDNKTNLTDFIAHTGDTSIHHTLSELDNRYVNITGDTMSGPLIINSNLTVTGSSILNQVTGDTIFVNDYIQFNTGYTGNTIVEGRMYWHEDDQTIHLGLHNGVEHHIGQDVFYLIKNQSGSTIEKGRVIKASGTLGSSGKILGEYMIADGTIPAKFTLGIATEDILDGDDGYVTEFGLIKGVNTTGSLYGEIWNNGDILWVSPTVEGGLTNVEPSSPNLHIEMAIVINASVNGSIFIRPHRYPYSYDLQDMGWSGGTEQNLDIIQWNSSLGYFNLTNTPNFVSLSAQTISATTFFGDGSNLTGVVGEDNYVSGGTYNSLTKNLEFYGTNSATTFNVSLSAFTGGSGSTSGDTYVTGGTYNQSTNELTLFRNDNIDVTITGFTGGSGTTGNIRIVGVRNRLNNNSLFLRYEDGLPYNNNPYRCYKDLTIDIVVASSSSLDTWKALISTGTTIPSDVIYQLGLVGQDVKYDNSINLNVNSGTTLYLYMSGSSVDYPKMEVYLK